MQVIAGERTISSMDIAVAWQRGVFHPLAIRPPEIRMHGMRWMHAIGAPAIIQIMLHQPDTPLPQTHAVGCAIRQIRYHASQYQVALPLVMDPWSERVQEQYTQWLAQAHRRDQWSSIDQIAAALVSGMPEVLSFTTPPLATEPDHVIQHLGAMVTRYGLGGTALAGAWNILRCHIPSWESWIGSATLELSNLMTWWHPAVWRSLPASVQARIVRSLDHHLSPSSQSILLAWLAGYPVDHERWLALLSSSYEPWGWFVAGMVGHPWVHLDAIPRLEERDRAIIARRYDGVLPWDALDIIALRDGPDVVIPLVEYWMEMTAPLPPAPITAVIGKERWARWVDAWVAHDQAVDCPVLDRMLWNRLSPNDQSAYLMRNGVDPQALAAEELAVVYTILAHNAAIPDTMLWRIRTPAVARALTDVVGPRALLTTIAQLDSYQWRLYSRRYRAMFDVYAQ